MTTLSRRKLAEHVVTRLSRGDNSSKVMNELAAFLVDTKRTNEAELVIRDVESVLVSRGTVLARITSARSLEADAKDAIKLYVKTQANATAVSLAESIDESVIGGVRIEFPGHQLDVTVKAKLEKLTAL